MMNHAITKPIAKKWIASSVVFFIRNTAPHPTPRPLPAPLPAPRPAPRPAPPTPPPTPRPLPPSIASILFGCSQRAPHRIFDCVSRILERAERQTLFFGSFCCGPRHARGNESGLKLFQFCLIAHFCPPVSTVPTGSKLKTWHHGVNTFDTIFYIGHNCTHGNT